MDNKRSQPRQISGTIPSVIMKSGEPLRVFFSYIRDPSFCVLDIGCAGGYFLEELKKRGFAKRAGIDLEKYAETDFDFKIGDVCYDPLPWKDASFDAVSAWEVFEHLENPHFLAREIHRVLKPGGFFFISMPNALQLESRLQFLKKGNLPRWSEKNDHIAVFTPAIFRKTILKNFTLVEVKYPLPRLGKSRILGGIRKRFSSVDTWLPANEWFGSYVIYVLRKEVNFQLENRA